MGEFLKCKIFCKESVAIWQVFAGCNTVIMKLRSSAILRIQSQSTKLTNSIVMEAMFDVTIGYDGNYEWNTESPLFATIMFNLQDFFREIALVKSVILTLVTFAQFKTTLKQHATSFLK